MTNTELGQTLRECRFKAGLTQLQLAGLLHIDRTHISKIEIGDREPHFRLVYEWLHVTNCHEYFVSVLSGHDWQEVVETIERFKKIEAIITEPIA
jgi:transcriptional regulator with XRE-family HTH domain